MNILVVFIIGICVKVSFSAPVAEYADRPVSDVISSRDELVKKNMSIICNAYKLTLFSGYFCFICSQLQSQNERLFWKLKEFHPKGYQSTIMAI